MDHPVSNHGFKIKEGKMGADYTNSAENLCNPPEVLQQLIELHQVQATISSLEGILRENEAYKALKAEEKLVADLTARIKDMVDAQGSYQDLETGEYAVKYRRMTKSYHVEPFKENYAKFISAVVEETINAKALDGLVKGKLFDEQGLKESGVITETATYAYYIR